MSSVHQQGAGYGGSSGPATRECGLLSRHGCLLLLPFCAVCSVEKAKPILCVVVITYRDWLIKNRNGGLPVGELTEKQSALHKGENCCLSCGLAVELAPLGHS